jgi:hypothetical protein
MRMRRLCVFASLLLCDKIILTQRGDRRMDENDVRSSSFIGRINKSDR